MEQPNDKDRQSGLDEAEQLEAEEQTRPGARVVYETVRREGQEELGRPAVSLWWSGVAAGIAISNSVFVQGYLQAYLPDAVWRPLVSKLGYSVGFLIVVLGRMQLFTENTLSAVLPVLADRKVLSLLLVLRLWSIVLVANLTGTAVAAMAMSYAHVSTDQQLADFLLIAEPLLHNSSYEIMLRGIPAGFLVAAMVWMAAASRDGRFWIVALMSYTIALGGFTHVIAGSTEVFLLILDHQLSLMHGLFGITAPTLLGNVLGGTVLFALLAYGQVKGEM